MIVMKFGGTSVESAAAIERVAGIVKARVERQPGGGGLGHGQDHQQAAGHRRGGHSRASATSTSGSFTTCAISIRARRGRWCRWRSAPNSTASLDEHFQELTELVKGLAVLGELTPRSIDAISSYGERLSSYIVTLAFRHFGMPAEHLDSRDVIITDQRHTQAAPLFPETYARLARSRAAAGASERGGDGRLHRRPPRTA